MSGSENGDRRSAIACPRFLGPILTVVCLVALAVILRPLLRGLAVVAADILMVVGLLFVIYVALKRARTPRAAEPSATADDHAPEEPEPLRPTSTKPTLADAARSIEIEDELRDIKKQLGKE